MPSFCIGRTGDQMLRDMETLASRVPNCVAVTLDGSGFDSTQHADNIRSVDVALITSIWPIVVKKTAEWPIYLPPTFLEHLYRQCTCLVKQMYVEDKGKKLIRYTVTGTTFSGYCLNTTLGNTLRSILYTRV